MADRFGLGWRPELAAAIHLQADRLDLVEVIADDWMLRSAREQRALHTLASQTTVVLHGVSLGLCSTAPVDERRLQALARLVDRIQPAAWSEHLAFVRAGGVEIGHLAAPPRGEATLAGLARNVARARAAVGATPLLENVASLVEPPGSELPEAEWLPQALAAADAPLLLDLHNLHANATNFGFRAIDVLDALPWERVRAIHLAGGRPWGPGEPGVTRPRLLDDHQHDVPDPVYDLLREVGRRAPGPLDVVLERDGRFPDIEVLLGELDRARAALAAGRAEPRERLRSASPSATGLATDFAMSRRLEALLARLYTDAAARDAFLADPAAGWARHALPAPGGSLDVEGLRLAARSFAAKRARQGERPTEQGAWWQRLGWRFGG